MDGNPTISINTLYESTRNRLLANIPKIYVNILFLDMK